MRAPTRMFEILVCLWNTRASPCIPRQLGSAWSALGGLVPILPSSHPRDVSTIHLSKSRLETVSKAFSLRIGEADHIEHSAGVNRCREKNSLIHMRHLILLLASTCTAQAIPSGRMTCIKSYASPGGEVRCKESVGNRSTRLMSFAVKSTAKSRSTHKGRSTNAGEIIAMRGSTVK